MFWIIPNNPTGIKLVGEPVSSLGHFPSSIGINPRDGRVCVLNARAINGTMCYTPDPVQGLIKFGDFLISGPIFLPLPSDHQEPSHRFFSLTTDERCTSQPRVDVNPPHTLKDMSQHGMSTRTAPSWKGSPSNQGWCSSTFRGCYHPRYSRHHCLRCGDWCYHLQLHLWLMAISEPINITGQGSIWLIMLTSLQHFMADFPISIIWEVKVVSNRGDWSIVNSYVLKNYSTPIDRAVGAIGTQE
jgi:hypothetical protein